MEFILDMSQLHIYIEGTATPAAYRVIYKQSSISILQGAEHQKLIDALEEASGVAK